MGSDSDLPVMAEAAEVLESLEVGCECTVVSAHRTPERMVSYAEEAAGRGLRLIIAGAGGAAHLPGMVAALTPLPVIGVPIRSSSLHGIDSLLSIVQMPRGVPVATVAINGAKNAALLAVRVLALSDEELAARHSQLMESERDQVLARAERLEELGPSGYMDSKTHHGL
jgi:phosphoribosylaminoimidazole carboxylase PurE protein